MMKLLLVMAALFGAAQPATPRYAEGQVWEYRTRPGEEASLLKIQRIEDHPAFASGGPVYHISVIGVRLGPQIASILPHLPVSRTTLDASVTRLSTRQAEFPSPDEGIAEWRQARGGVFTISMAEILDFVQQTVSPPPPQ
jgi:hypothetical protein